MRPDILQGEPEVKFRVLQMVARIHLAQMRVLFKHSSAPAVGADVIHYIVWPTGHSSDSLQHVVIVCDGHPWVLFSEAVVCFSAVAA